MYEFMNFYIGEDVYCVFFGVDEVECDYGQKVSEDCLGKNLFDWDWFGDGVGGVSSSCYLVFLNGVF